MTNVDKLAREITAQLIPHLTSVQNVDLIKSALKSYGDECAKQMREEAKFLALEVLDEVWLKAVSIQRLGYSITQLLPEISTMKGYKK